METRTLGGTKLSVSRLCLGTMTFGAQVDQPTAASMLDLALDRGINFVDTANVYNKGAAETIVGAVLQGRRDKVILASKVGICMGDEPHETGLSRRTIQHQVEASLRRLQTDYLDIYYLHQPDESTPLEETLAAFDELVRQGKVRYVGASNYAAWQVCRMHWLAELHGWQPPVVMQPMYNLLARGIEQEFLPMCRALGLSTVVYNPLAGGLLSGKHRADRPPASGTRFDANPGYQSRYWHEENFEAVAHLRAAAQAQERSLVSLALGWLLHQTPIDGVILGASTLEQLTANLAAAEQGPCSTQTLGACDEAWRIVRGISPAYSR